MTNVLDLEEASLLESLDLAGTDQFVEADLSEIRPPSSPNRATVTTYLDPAYYLHCERPGINRSLSVDSSNLELVASIDLPFSHQDSSIPDEAPILPCSSTKQPFERFAAPLSNCLETASSSAFDESR
jgi:hypothetical protein